MKTLFVGSSSLRRLGLDVGVLIPAHDERLDWVTDAMLALRTKDGICRHNLGTLIPTPGSPHR